MYSDLHGSIFFERILRDTCGMLNINQMFAYGHLLWILLVTKIILTILETLNVVKNDGKSVDICILGESTLYKHYIETTHQAHCQSKSEGVSSVMFHNMSIENTHILGNMSVS